MAEAKAAPWPALKRSLIAILRGIRPDEIEAMVSVLVDAGFEAMEIPLNSPQPFASIEKAARLAPSHCIVGAGTVLKVEDVGRLAEAGGRVVVSPNVVPAVIAAAAAHGMISLPGVFTATEALLAADCGASGLKFFPASALGPGGIKAICAVLPDGLEISAVGGIAEAEFAPYAAAGVRTFGLGSNLFKPGMSPDDLRSKARSLIAAYDAAFGS